VIRLAIPSETTTMARKRGLNTAIPGLSFSWRQATGFCAAQSRLFRAIGVPLSRSARHSKICQAVWCCWILVLLQGVLGLIWLLG